MEINSRIFGQICIDDSKVIHFVTVKHIFTVYGPYLLQLRQTPGNSGDVVNGEGCEDGRYHHINDQRLKVIKVEYLHGSCHYNLCYEEGYERTCYHAQDKDAFCTFIKALEKEAEDGHPYENHQVSDNFLYSAENDRITHIFQLGKSVCHAACTDEQQSQDQIGNGGSDCSHIIHTLCQHHYQRVKTSHGVAHIVR